MHLLFHCFNISNHISISVLFFIISVSCFGFCWIFESNCPGGGVSARFFCPRGQLGFRTSSLCLGSWGIRPLKNSPGGGWSDLELTDSNFLHSITDKHLNM